MRYANPESAPSNGWPAGMKFDVLTNEPFLLEMLYLRAVWGIPAGADLPDVFPEPPPAAARPSNDEVGAIASGWDESWARGIVWASQAGARNERINAYFIDPDRDPTDLAAFLPPRWDRATDDVRLDRDAFDAWQAELSSDDLLDLSETPERKSLADLIGAWERGLRVMIVLPFAGHLSRQIGHGSLLLSQDAYTTPDSFSSALKDFRAH